MMIMAGCEGSEIAAHPPCRYYYVSLDLRGEGGVERRFAVVIDSLDNVSLCEIGCEETTLATAYEAIEMSREALRNAEAAAHAIHLYVDGKGRKIAREER